MISKSGMGAVKLGMKIGEARAALPAATFEQMSDGEGVPLIGVTVDGEQLLVLYAGDQPNDSAVDPNTVIEHIETFSTSCALQNDIGPGTTVLDAEKVLGKVRNISKSEIESREFVQFAAQPEWVTMRIDYTGVFGADSVETVRFDPKAKILSMSIRTQQGG